jgi:VanZ family protein
LQRKLFQKQEAIKLALILNTKIRRLVIDWMLLLTWMFLIFAGSTDLMSAEHTSRFLVPFLLWLDPHISFQTIMLVQLIVRKAGHVTEYAVLASLLWRVLRHHWPMVRRSFWRPAMVALVVAMIFATTDEFHQSFYPSRTATAHDVMIDTMGAIIGLVICWVFARNRLATKRGAI